MLKQLAWHGFKAALVVGLLAAVTALGIIEPDWFP
jgi:hypothetical protein